MAQERKYQAGINNYKASLGGLPPGAKTLADEFAPRLLESLHKSKKR